MSNHRQWLARQLPLWVDESIITAEQAQQLRQRYPTGDTLNLGRLLVSGIAAVMIGLGVILLFAYNWSEMGKFSKLAVIFSALIGAHTLALYIRPRHPIYSESLFALGTMLMGAGIFLVGQIYHLDSHYPDAFLFWALGALALAWTLPSLTQAFMAVVLVISWHLFEIIDFHFANHSVLLIILLGVLPLLWWLRSPFLARLSAATLLLTVALSLSVAEDDLVTITLLLTAMSLIALQRVGEESAADDLQQITAAVAGPGLLVLVAVMYLLSFNDLVPELIRLDFSNGIANAYFFITLIVSQLLFFWLLYRRRLNAEVIIAELTVVLALFPTLITLLSVQPDHAPSATLVALGFNLILLVLSVWMMIDGAREANRQHMVRGSILFALLAAARYTDLFDSLIVRALVFLLVGAALFAVSHYYQRAKQQVSHED